MADPVYGEFVTLRGLISLAGLQRGQLKTVVWNKQNEQLVALGYAEIYTGTGAPPPALDPYATREWVQSQLSDVEVSDADLAATVAAASATRTAVDARVRAVGDATYAPLGVAGGSAINRVVIIGPSLEEQIGQGASTVDPSFATPAQSAMRARGWFHWCNAALGNALHLDYNAGVGGNRYDQMLARFDADVIAHNPRFVFIGSATNDIGGGRTVAQITADLDAMIDKCRASGAQVIVMTIPPRSTHNTVSMRAKVAEINRYISALAGVRDGVIAVDLWRPLADPATGYPVPGTTADGTHYSVSGAAILGFHVAEKIRHLVTVRPRLVSYSTDPRRFIANPAMLANGTGWTATTGATAAFVAGDYGNTATITVTGNSSLTAVRGIVAESVRADGYWEPGDTLQTTCRLRWSDLVALTGETPCAPVLRIEQQNAGGTVLKTAHALYSTSIEWATWPTGNTVPLPTPKSGDVVLTTWLSTVHVDCAKIRLIVGWLGAASVTVKIDDMAPVKDAAATADHPSPDPYVRQDPGVTGYSSRWVAAELTGADGTAVASWTDTDTQIALTQPTGTKQPTLQTVGGVKVVRFDGVDDELRNTALTAYNSIAIVFRMADTAPTDTSPGLFSSADAMGVARGTSASQYRTNVFFAGTGRSVSPGTVTAPNGVGRFLVLRNNDGDARMEVNGVAVTNTTAATATTVTSLLLGQRNNSFGNIEIVEVMVFPTGLTDAQMATLYTYAKSQYPALFPA
ncbi:MULTISPECIES: GDSL-type esterase/lipase family protein [Rhodococcus]|uniref:SGNH/GDSL hydrolase family protein n=1 Tax=Rhodococcus TaxID=1827 RepID=UPI000C799B86|nr:MULTISPECIES: GDSL-type esterase/lipase family protein [Rhodococcus]AUM16455.1 hypothetical protein CSW53_07910 [Rhodococcus ruber]